MHSFCDNLLAFKRLKRLRKSYLFANYLWECFPAFTREKGGDEAWFRINVCKGDLGGSTAEAEV